MLRPIGIVQSCFKEKFGIPRQSGLVPAAMARISFNSEFQTLDAFKAIEQFSHLWILFLFHGIPDGKWHLMVRPPKLGGSKRVGVFASRSPYRPNPIGLSVVKNDGIRIIDRKIYLYLSGGDFLDGTPVLDIKPYHPGADCILGATMGYAEKPWLKKKLLVRFSLEAQEFLTCLSSQKYPNFQNLIEQVISQDPRPGYDSSSDKLFGICLYDFNIKWRVDNEFVEVVTIEFVEK